MVKTPLINNPSPSFIEEKNSQCTYKMLYMIELTDKHPDGVNAELKHKFMFWLLQNQSSSNVDTYDDVYNNINKDNIMIQLDVDFA